MTERFTGSTRLRTDLVAKLRRSGALRTDAVTAAFLAVERADFTPGETPETAYGDRPVITKKDEHGVPVSSVSAPDIQAAMLEQARLSPGLRVLEVGSGGVNAAMIAEIVGPGGSVTSVDIDPDVVERARRCLAAAGYPQVRVVLADADDGVPGYAPYDRVIVTVCAPDIPPAWVGQLTDGGRLVVPLRMRGLTRSVAFERQGAVLRSRDHTLCGFVPMRGAGADRERVIRLHRAQVGLRVDGRFDADVELLREALFRPVADRIERWSGVTVARQEPFDGLDLWLSANLPGFCHLTTGKVAAAGGRIGPHSRRMSPASVLGGTLAYGALRANHDRSTFEFGVYSHGPEAENLAERYADLIRTWDRTGPPAEIAAYPAGTAELPAGHVIDKPHRRLVISWHGVEQAESTHDPR